MKPSILAVAILATTVSAFQQPKNTNAASRLEMSNMKINDTEDSRRAFLKTGAAVVLGLSGQVFQPDIASAGLLDEYGADPSKIKTESEAAKTTTAAVASKKTESNLEPNLRSNYYYPTNKKRYLPRIKKCNDAIPDAASMIGNEDWEGVEIFCSKIADDTILPMKLYTSSLLGGGTNVKVAFAKDMNDATKSFETAQKKLTKAIAKKDQQKSSAALEDMATALLAYRTAGRLLGPDGGGDIPSVDDIRRSASRTQKSFQNRIADRDERVKM